MAFLKNTVVRELTLGQRRSPGSQAAGQNFQPLPSQSAWWPKICPFWELNSSKRTLSWGARNLRWKKRSCPHLWVGTEREGALSIRWGQCLKKANKSTQKYVFQLYLLSKKHFLDWQNCLWVWIMLSNGLQGCSHHPYEKVWWCGTVIVKKVRKQRSCLWLLHW